MRRKSAIGATRIAFTGRRAFSIAFANPMIAFTNGGLNSIRLAVGEQRVGRDARELVVREPATAGDRTRNAPIPRSEGEGDYGTMSGIREVARLANPLAPRYRTTSRIAPAPERDWHGNR